jgi:hypothetical protein
MSGNTHPVASYVPGELIPLPLSGSIPELPHVAKVFLGVEGKSLQPLMRFTRGDVRDHIVSSKIDHGPLHRRYRALQR